MAVVERMPNSPYKTALIVAIQSRMEALRVQLRPNGTGEKLGSLTFRAQGASTECHICSSGWALDFQPVSERAPAGKTRPRPGLCDWLAVGRRRNRDRCPALSLGIFHVGTCPK